MKTSAERDAEELAGLLRGAVKASGLSQTVFAHALGTSQARFSKYVSGGTTPSALFVLRARRLGAALHATAERGIPSVPVTALTMRQYLRAGDTQLVWRAMLAGRDALRTALAEEDLEVVDSWEVRPLIGSLKWDTLLAAIVAHEFTRAGLAAPAWTEMRPIGEPWSPANPLTGPELVRPQTPEWLARYNIFVPDADLRSA